MTKKALIWKYLKEYGLITVSSLLYALCFNWFFRSNNIAFGGFTGISQVINALVPVVPVGVLTIVMNVPLFIIGIKKMGFGILFSSLYAMASGSLLVDAMNSVVQFDPMDPLLASIYGGVLLGLSLGLMLLVNATTGGTELLARLLKFRFRHMSMGKLCLGIDLAVIATYAAVFKSINNALYGIIALYISTIVMDMVIYGSRTAELAYIISDKSAEIVRKLLDLEMGVTVLEGRGAYTGNNKQVILIAFKRHRVALVKSLVMEIDPLAFVIVTQAHEVLGEGFDIYTNDSL